MRLPDSGRWTRLTCAPAATLYLAVLATVLGKAALETTLWQKYSWLAIPGSFVFTRTSSQPATPRQAADSRAVAFIVVYSVVAPRIGFSKEL